MIDEEALNIFTDGSSYSNPRTGGIGIRFVTVNAEGHEVIEDIQVQGYKGATNNSMELYACVVALREAAIFPKINDVKKICILTDSRYVVDNLNYAKFNWPKTKWHTKNGTPVLNADLWKQLLKEIKQAPHFVRIDWIKGHSKNVHNKAVDKLAKQSAKGFLNKPLSIIEVRRKKTKKTVNSEGVEMKGQRLAISIITSQYLKVQKIIKYKYEVISKRSKYFGNVGIIYSEGDMRAGHHYEISVNNDTLNPRVLKILKEIDRKKGATSRIGKAAL